MPIKIDRAVYGPDWEKEVSTIDWEGVVAGVGAILSSPPRVMPSYTRWALWESEVLSKCTNDHEAMQELIAARQTSLSETEQLSRDLEEALDGWLAENQSALEDHDDGYVMSGQDLAYVFQLVSANGVKWNARSVARKLVELRWLDGRIQKHPDTSKKRYVVSAAEVPLKH